MDEMAQRRAKRTCHCRGWIRIAYVIYSYIKSFCAQSNVFAPPLVALPPKSLWPVVKANKSGHMAHVQPHAVFSVFLQEHTCWPDRRSPLGAENPSEQQAWPYFEPVDQVA